MRPRLPRVTSPQVSKVLVKWEFCARSSGSHFIYVSEQSRRVTVPSHAGKILHPKLLKTILADADLSVDDFISLLGS